MPAYTSTPGKSKAVQAYGGKVTKKRPGSNVALGPAPTTYSPSYSSSSSSGATSTSSSGATTTSSPPRRTAAQRRASRIRKVARITKDDPKVKQQLKRIKREKPIATKAEDSLAPKVFEKMVAKDYQYAGGKWYPPKDYKGYFQSEKGGTSKAAKDFMSKPVMRDVRKAYRTGEVTDIRGKEPPKIEGRGTMETKPLLRREAPSQLSKRTKVERELKRIKPFKKIRIPEDPKVQGRKEKVVAKRLTKAAKKSQGGLVRKLDRAFDENEQITPDQAAIVAEAHGLPGITYSRAIIPGESNFRPGVRNPDDATPSLFQITPSVQSAETQAKFDKIASKRKGGYSNPIVAAKQARVLAGDSADEGVSNYVAFNPSAPQGHLPGGQKRARQVLYGKPKPIAKKLKRKAVKVLGKEAAEKVVKKAKKPTTSAGLKPVPLKTLKQHVKFTESKSEVSSEQGAPARVTLTKMNPELQNALVRLSKQTGIPVEINEGYRTVKRANEFPSGTGSQHHQGNAADVNNHGDYTQEQLAAAGLNNTSVGGEPWHFQPNELGTAGAPVVGGSTSATGTTGITSSGGTAPTSSGKGTTTTKKARRRSERARSRKQLLNEILNTPDAQPADPLEGYTRPTTTAKRTSSIGL